MAFVVSSGQLAISGAGVTPMFSAMPIAAAPWEYETIWRTQPQVRTVISFLARNIGVTPAGVADGVRGQLRTARDFRRRRAPG